MARTRRDHRGRSSAPRRITVRGVKRKPVDIRKLSRALITLAQAQAEADAQAQAARSTDDAAPVTDEESHS